MNSLPRDILGHIGANEPIPRWVVGNCFGEIGREGWEGIGQSHGTTLLSVKSTSWRPLWASGFNWQRPTDQKGNREDWTREGREEDKWPGTDGSCRIGIGFVRKRGGKWTKMQIPDPPLAFCHCSNPEKVSVIWKEHFRAYEIG